MYLKGKGAEQEDKKLLSGFFKPEEQGYVLAQYRLAFFF